jgi:hypothetical protein
MSRFRPGFLAFIIIIVIAGISIAIPMVYFAEANSDLIVDEEWTPGALKTPTQNIAPTRTPITDEITSTEISPQRNPTLAASSTSEANMNCVYPAEYWKEHPELWLEMLVGNTMYSRDDILLILDNTSREVDHVLLQQLYLANMNILSGADPTSIGDLLSDANKWLQLNSPDSQLSDESRQLGIRIAQILIDFNTGLIGPGFCSPYEGLIVTPLVIIEPTLTPSLTPSQTATATATQVKVYQQPIDTAKPKKEKEDPKPTKKPDTPVPPPPTKAPPKPTKEPTSAPTDVP